MIDIHSHVLPGMDDGAKDLDEARKLIDTLKSQGISLLVLTPHFYPDHERLETFIDRREHSFEMIRENDIELRLASETYLSEALFSYEDIKPLCIQGTNYLLLELPYIKEWGSHIYQMIEKVMGKFGLQPIIAHIERYEAVHHRGERERILTNLVDMGCLLQINIDSVIGKRERSATLKLIKNGWADFVGSDCHNLTNRPPHYDEFNEIVTRKLGREYLDAFNENARAILL